MLYLSGLRDGTASLTADGLKRLGIVDRHLAQLLAVELDAGLLDAVNKLRVAQVVRTDSGRQARDPQAAEQA